MKNGKKITYADLLADTEIHAEYEKGLDLIRPDLGRSHPIMIGGREVFSAPEFEVVSPFDKRISVGKFQTATPEPDPVISHHRTSWLSRMAGPGMGRSRRDHYENCRDPGI